MNLGGRRNFVPSTHTKKKRYKTNTGQIKSLLPISKVYMY